MWGTKNVISNFLKLWRIQFPQIVKLYLNKWNEISLKIYGEKFSSYFYVKKTETYRVGFHLIFMLKKMKPTGHPS